MDIFSSYFTYEGQNTYSQHFIRLLINEKIGGKITHRYDAALLGFSAEMPDVSVSSLNSHKHVDYIEPDGEVSIYAKKLLSGDNK